MRATPEPIARTEQHPRLNAAGRHTRLIRGVASLQASTIAHASEITALAVVSAIAAANRIDRITVGAESHADACAQRKHGGQHDGLHIHVSFLVVVAYHDGPVVGRAVNRSYAAMRFASARARCEAEALCLVR
jgi:hypothetical protein